MQTENNTEGHSQRTRLKDTVKETLATKMEEEGGRILTERSGCVPEELRCLAEVELCDTDTVTERLRCVPVRWRYLPEVELCDTDREIELCARGVEVFGRG